LLYAIAIIFIGLYYLKNLIFPPFSLENEFGIMACLMLYCATFPANLFLQAIVLVLDFLGMSLENNIFHYFFCFWNDCPRLDSMDMYCPSLAKFYFSCK